MINNLEDNLLFKSIFQSSVEGILVVDEQGYIIKANPAGENMFGYAPQELISQKVESLIPTKFRNNHQSHRAHYAVKPKARRMGHNLDLWGLKKDGSQFPLEISLSPTTIDSNQVVIVFVIDTTIRKATQQALVDSESRMAEAQQIAQVGNWYWNLKTNERSWSNEFYRIYGLLPGDERLTKASVSNFIHPNDRENELKTIAHAIENQTDYQYEKRIVRLDNSIRYVISKGVITYDENGKPFEMLGTTQDITQQKETEKELKDSEDRNKVILEVLPDMMFILNNQGEYLDLFAPETRKLLKLKENFIGKNIKEILPKETYQALKVSLNDVSDNKKPQLIEFSLKDQKTFRFYEARIVRFDDNRLLAIVRDITSKKQLDNTLSIRTRALSAASNGIIIVDSLLPDSPIVYSNDSFFTMTGYSESDIIGHNCRFLQGTDHDQEEIGIMSNAVKKGEACNVVLRNYRKDGSLFWNEISLTPVFNDQKVMTHFIGVLNDVTLRKKDDLFKSANKDVMDMIIQYLPLELIGKKIIETIETAIPNCMVAILLLNKETKTLYNLASPSIPKSFSDGLEGISIQENTCSCGTAVNEKREVIVADISISPLWEGYTPLAQDSGIKSCWCFPIYSTDQEVLGIFAIYSNTIREPLAIEKDIIQDITRIASVAIEQHSISNALRQSTEKLAAYAEQLENKVNERTNALNVMVEKLTTSNLNLKDQILETKEAENRVLISKQLLDDVSHNFPGGFISVVDFNLRVVFIGGEELVALGFENLAKNETLLDDITGVSDYLKTLIKDKIVKTLEGEHLSFEVEYRDNYYLVNTTPLANNENKIKQVLLVYNNITLQKKAEFDMFTTLKKEQELSELKSRFIAMASHEFRTPLSAILSSAILIEKQNGVGKEEKRTNYVSKIRSNVKNLVVILNDFLSLSKLQEGKVIVQPVLFDMVAFSKSLIEELEDIKKNGQFITLKYDHLKIEAFLDLKLLKHIIYNLLSNAIKYSEENQEITIEVKSNDQQVAIEISDHGIGIPTEDQKNMFQRFYRANNASNIQGTGLGLHIVKQYTELMGGSIRFTSQLKEGSTFYITFPLHKKTNE
ncbi:PAS domain S-box protein [Flavobacterium sp. 14A]|uniref:PAS domain S-box protein n=1 Tax=Flavobacterium sp. 14A TaxID=2735896 RepID=UPI00156F1368|nr:PAS domain S-box protein [Flavobacterium sp. 14A]NRT10815.1 PAS domain S-box-containing protein [Flavobacterium sp. 14A]